MLLSSGEKISAQRRVRLATMASRVIGADLADLLARRCAVADERKVPRQLDLLCMCHGRGRQALDSLRTGGDHGDVRRCNGPRAPGESDDRSD